MRNCDRDRERERDRETETVPSTALPNCCETRLKWAFQYLRRANPHSVLSIAPTPLSHSPLPSLFSHHLTWLAKHFLHWAFPSEFALVCAAYLKQFCDVNCGSAAQLLFLALAFCRWLLRPFWGCLCFAWLLRVEVGCAQKCSQCVCVMCVYVYLMCMCSRCVYCCSLDSMYGHVILTFDLRGFCRNLSSI